MNYLIDCSSACYILACVEFESDYAPFYVVLTLENREEDPSAEVFCEDCVDHHDQGQTTEQGKPSRKLATTPILFYILLLLFYCIIVYWL